MKGGFVWRLAVVVLDLNVWFAPAWALLPPTSSKDDDTAIQLEGTVLAITHTDEDRGPDPRMPTSMLTPDGQRIPMAPGERRLERVFDLTIRIRKTVKARNPGMPLPPSGKIVVVHGSELFGPWPRSGVSGIDRLAVGARARFYLEQQSDGAWSILEPDGLVLLDGSWRADPATGSARAPRR